MVIRQHHLQWSLLLVSTYCNVQWRMLQRILQVLLRIRILRIVAYAVWEVQWLISSNHHHFKTHKPARATGLERLRIKRKTLLLRLLSHQMVSKTKIWLYQGYPQRRISLRAIATAYCNPWSRLYHPKSLMIDRNANYGGDNKRRNSNLLPHIPSLLP